MIMPSDMFTSKNQANNKTNLKIDVDNATFVHARRRFNKPSLLPFYIFEIFNFDF